MASSATGASRTSSASPPPRSTTATPTASPSPQRCGAGPAASKSGARVHWDAVYRTRSIAAVSWYFSLLFTSLALLLLSALHADARLIDVCGGASSLVDDLLAS